MPMRPGDFYYIVEDAELGVLAGRTPEELVERLRESSWPSGAYAVTPVKLHWYGGAGTHPGWGTLVKDVEGGVTPAPG
jgi:hypothetical protein